MKFFLHKTNIIITNFALQMPTYTYQNFRWGSGGNHVTGGSPLEPPFECAYRLMPSSYHRRDKTVVFPVADVNRALFIILKRTTTTYVVEYNVFNLWEILLTAIYELMRMHYLHVCKNHVPFKWILSVLLPKLACWSTVIRHVWILNPMLSTFCFRFKAFCTTRT